MLTGCGQCSEGTQTNLKFLWLDNSNETSDLLSVQERKIQSRVKDLKKFETEEECTGYIHKTQPTECIVLIITQQCAKIVVPSIHQQCQIVTVFIYHLTDELSEQWLPKYTKIKTVQLNMLEKHVKWFQAYWARNSSRYFLPMNIFNPKNIGLECSSIDTNGTFLFQQLILDAILNIKSTPDDKDKFVRACAKLYKSSNQQIKDLTEFNINYNPEDAFNYYIQSEFIFQLLNRAFRIKSIELLLLFRFFIRDLKKQLEQHRYEDLVHVYRGQLISKLELDHLSKSIGQLISMNSFLSTSLQKSVALQFLGLTVGVVTRAPNGLKYVLFEIHANPNLPGGVPPFATISGINGIGEEEILFDCGSVFRINHVQPDPTNPHVTIVSMTVCGNDEHGLTPVFDSMKKEYQEDDIESSTEGKNPISLSLGMVLLNGGCFESARNVFVRMLHSLRKKPRSVHLGKCYHYIGEFYRQRNQFWRSRKWYRKALAVYASVFPNENELVATTHLCLGHAYSKTTDWKCSTWYRTDLANWWEMRISKRWQRSRTSYERALSIYQRTYDEDHPRTKTAACYLSLGSFYYNGHNYLAAMVNYQKALKIETTLLPARHPAFAYCHDKLGHTFWRLQRIDQAIIHFEQALQTGLNSLQGGHPLVIELYYVLGYIYKVVGKNEQAEEYFRKQFDLVEYSKKPIASMVEVVQISGGKICYRCPRCGLPVWVYSSCPTFKGKICSRCLRELLHSQQIPVLRI